jgi:hypothetical protein
LLPNFSFENGFDLFSQFQFSDKLQKGMLYRHFIKAVAKSLERYCSHIFEIFSDVDNNSSYEFVFTREFVTKTNNILYCRYNLHNLLSKFTDNSGEISKHSKRIEPKNDVTQFGISIISANEIVGIDPIWKTSNVFTRIQLGTTLYGNSKVVYNTCAPIWNEAIPIPIELPNSFDNSESFLSLNVRHSGLSSDTELGVCNVFLRNSMSF